jgi:hypothetical protein
VDVTNPLECSSDNHLTPWFCSTHPGPRLTTRKYQTNPDGETFYKIPDQEFRTVKVMQNKQNKKMSQVTGDKGTRGQWD